MSRVTPAAQAHMKVLDNLVEWGRRGNAPLETRKKPTPETNTRNQHPNRVSDPHEPLALGIVLEVFVKRPPKRAEAVAL